MIYIESNSTSPYYNFALEYYLMTEKQFKDDTVFMFWRTPPTVMVGHYQNTYSEINLPYVQEHDLNVVRRLSGGGTIYTDMGSWQFTFIVKKEKETSISFEQFVSPIVKSLQRIGLDASLSGRNDLIIDGRKFSGNAQYIKNGYVLHHGSILFSTDIEEMVRSTTVDDYKIISKGIKSVRERVTNLSEHLKQKMTVLEFKQLMVDSILSNSKSTYQLTQQDDEIIKRIAAEKFDNWQAIYGSSPQCSIVRKNHFAGGIVECHLNISEGTIVDVQIFGDFFGTFDAAEFCNILKGCQYDRESISLCLHTAHFNPNLYNITLDDLIATIAM